MENYEQKYKEALKRAKTILELTDNPEEANGYVFTIFPELCESEDERIRKGLIKGLSAMRDIHKHQTFSDDAINIDDAISWLEKQGTPAKLSDEEKKSFVKGVLSNCALSFIDYLDAHKYEGKMCASNLECEDIDYAFHNAMWDRLHRYYCKYIEKQGEQKSSWSEEDESMFLMCSDAIAAACAAAYYTTEEMNKMQNWLKSLKPNHWKPSEEQMEALNDVRHLNPGLDSLYWKLKKS